MLVTVVFFLSFAVSYRIEKKKLSTGEGEPPLTPIDALSGTDNTSDESESETAAATDAIPENAATESKLPEPIIVNMPSDETWSLVLLNKYYKMNDNYEPHLDECIENTAVYLDKRVSEKFVEMYNAAKENGVILTPASGYVSPDRQKRSFDKQTESYVEDGYTKEKSEALASFTVLPVGCSEHNYGLAIDIGSRSAEFKETPAYIWLKQHAAEYGFIERYTAEKESVTHFSASPWHWRYVGVKYAKEINARGVCLEEYVGRVK